MNSNPIHAAERAAIARRAAGESIVLLKNESATLPFPAGASVRVVAPDGWRYCGEGSAVVNCAHASTVAEGLAGAGFRVADDATDAAVLIVSRYSREGQDAKQGDAFLSDAEKDALARFRADGVKRVAVVLNLGCGFDAAALADDPAAGAVLHAWFPGQEGGLAVADILSGAVNPSGRLAATLGSPRAWPCDSTFQALSHAVPYEEDIFVGYRWFETVPGESSKAPWPFGHGLSYTEWKTEAVESGPCQDGAIGCRVRVTNAGAVAGRHSVLLYSGVEGGEAGHPARELRAYAKTRLLRPGEDETLALSFAADDLAYFADEGPYAGSWVVDRGEYSLYVGGSVREASKAASFRVDAPRIVSSPGLKLNPGALPKRLRADGSAALSPVVPDAPAGNESACEPPPAAASIRYPQPTYAGSRPRTLFDVARGELSLDEFLAQLPREQQARLCLGNPVLHPSYGKCIGGTEPRLGLTGVVPANACQGVQKRIGPATCFPCSALVACSFDDALAEDVAEGIGSECVEADVDILLGPGLDIHRHPSCGRNFEYFSEDPLLSGRMAAAYVRGLRRTGTLACLKHFACNDRELFRDHYSSIVSERALREIHLKGFEIAVKMSDPASIMTAYNRVNGRRCGVFHGMVQGVLRDEWGWDGVIVSDCGAKSRPWEEVAAGSDVHLNGAPPDPDPDDLLRHVFQYRVVPRSYFMATARRVLRLVMKSRRFAAWMERWG